MDKWSRSAKITYKLWRNPEPRGEAGFVSRSDEDQGTDQEICTADSANVDLGGKESASRSRFDKTEEGSEPAVTGTFTVDEALEAIGFGKFHWKIGLLTGLPWVGAAMAMMVLTILGPQLHCEWRLPIYKVALIILVVFVGMGIGSPLWGIMTDWYGRRVALMICMCWTLYYSLLSAFTPAYVWLLALRGLVGFGVGGAPQSVTLYSEFLPVKSRGTCIMMIQVFWAIGSVLEVLLALLIMPTLGWKWLLGLSAIPLAIFVCFSIWLPESPRSDVLRGKTEKAVATLTHIAKENGKAMPQGKVIAYKQKDRGRLKDLLTPQYWRTTLLLWFIWFVNAFCYYGIVLLTTSLFQTGDSCEATKVTKMEPSCSVECKYLTSADYKDLLWTTMAEFPGILVTLLVMDRIGRKKSMALCFFMFSLCMLPLFACIARTAVTFLIFIARAFIFGGYQAAFVYTTEVFPTDNRALAVGISSGMSRLGALITPFVAQVMLQISQYLTLSLYCGCSLLAGVACLLLPIETLGRVLQESSLDQAAGEQAAATTRMKSN